MAMFKFNVAVDWERKGRDSCRIARGKRASGAKNNRKSLTKPFSIINIPLAWFNEQSGDGCLILERKMAELSIKACRILHSAGFCN
ncbi:hypothetical protein E4665_12430 [Sporolactobacillus shoreae]|uniref:Uncharacterized protein n=1 Tax=Sporolactobacillus shoreae TaxID=1465501 RepID=A0A4Z0GK06_9BACL|nr:hypothetical protein [Sporolactobacillus shoreae]TGA97201.1 hypothetical protein E4665_12430 [Sporolactobacillus shoreae]